MRVFRHPMLFSALLVVAMCACTAGSLEDGGDDTPQPVECTVTAPTECVAPDLRYADVEPVLAARCTGCHDGSGAEWPLTSYGHVVDWQDDIRTELLRCTMPPASSDVRMTTEERQLFLDWLRCGAPE